MQICAGQFSLHKLRKQSGHKHTRLPKMAARRKSRRNALTNFGQEVFTQYSQESYSWSPNSKVLFMVFHFLPRVKGTSRNLANKAQFTYARWGAMQRYVYNFNKNVSEGAVVHSSVCKPVSSSRLHFTLKSKILRREGQARHLCASFHNGTFHFQRLFKQN